MSKQLNKVLPLLDSLTPEQLILDFLHINQYGPHIEGLITGLVNKAQACIECYAIKRNAQRALKHTEIKHRRYEISLYDVSHPLIHVIRNGAEACWQTLHRGLRIDEPAFRHFVCELPGECGLFARPVFDNHAVVCGVAAAFSLQPERCQDNRHIFNLSFRLFQSQIKNLLELTQLRGQLRQIQSVFREQQQRQKQLDQLLSELSRVDTGRTAATCGQDYSYVKDLDRATEAFAHAVLTQRMRQFQFDKQQVARSLNLSLRMLNYRLMKYGCEG